MFRGRPGECLLIETNKEVGYIKSHLFVIILNAEEHTRNTIIVNIQTIRDGKYDKTVVLHPGDHPFIDRDSYVNYRLSRIISLDELERKIYEGTAVLKEPLNDVIFQQVCEGIGKSIFTPLEVKEMYHQFLFNNL
ncbi:MAG: hypothetical protein ABFD58_08725 [Anaerolineaceae bacterium]